MKMSRLSSLLLTVHHLQALARALYSRSPLLILDDAWSGLDSKNARLVEDSLFGVNGYCQQAGISVILTAHTGMI